MSHAFIAALSTLLSSQSAVPEDRLLTRRYREGEQLVYVMKAVNNKLYEITATGVVKKDTAGSSTPICGSQRRLEIYPNRATICTTSSTIHPHGLTEHS